jgi:hypothetical protein
VGKIDRENRKENGIKNSINKGIAETAMINGLLWNTQISRKN